jgi:chromosome segregation ATPase
MDNKIASYGLVGVSLLLAFGLFIRHSSATDAAKVAAEREEKLVGALKVLEAQNTTIRSEADLLAERLKTKTAEATSSAAQNETRAVENRAAAERAQFEKAIADYQRAVKDRDTALANVTQANEQMAKQAEQLNAEITKQQGAMKDLNAQIAAKEQQLQTAKGERDLLTRELKDLIAKRTELERQLHDLAFLKEQIATLKAEQHTARRFAWFREGTLNDERRGATRLLEPTKDELAAAAKPGPLRIELSRDGTVKLAP